MNQQESNGLETNKFNVNQAIRDVEPWPEPVDGNVLLDEVRGVLLLFLVLPQWAAETLALWILHTFAFEHRDVSTYIGLESPEKRCGKTTLLTVLSDMVNRPVVAANISSSAFFRVIEETRPTLLIDETDTFLTKDEAMRGILNAGYHRKTAFVMRVTTQAGERESVSVSERDMPGSRLVRFSCWCPKVMAAIGRLPETLGDRCIIIRMERKTAEERCDRLRNLDATVLRRKCARFVLDHAAAIATAQPVLPASLNDRAADICEPLLVLADLAGGHWPETARKAMIGLSERAQDNNPIGSLLLDIFLSFSTMQMDRMFTQTLVANLSAAAGRPWAERLNGKQLTDIWLAKQLRPYGVRPRTIWIGDSQAKGYMQEDFMEVFRRYIPRSEVEALKAEILGQKPEPGALKSEPGGQKLAGSDQREDDPDGIRGGQAAAA